MNRTASVRCGKWPASSKTLEAAPWHRRVRHVRVRARQDGVVRAPDEQGRHAARQVTAVDHRDGLAAPVDDGADGAHERAPCGGVGQRVEHAEQIVRVAPEIRLQDLEEADRRPTRRGARAAERSSGRNRAATGVAASRRERVHFVGDAAGGDQDEPLAPIGVLIGELHRDAATERVPDDGGALDAEHAEQVAHRVRVRGDGVVGARLVGSARGRAGPAR